MQFHDEANDLYIYTPISIISGMIGYYMAGIILSVIAAVSVPIFFKYLSDGD